MVLHHGLRMSVDFMERLNLILKGECWHMKLLNMDILETYQ